MKNIIRVVESMNNDVVYGYIVTDIDVDKIQEKIYEIKNSDEFLEEYPDWTIDDVIGCFPNDWDCEYIQDDNDVVEI